MVNVYDQRIFLKTGLPRRRRGETLAHETIEVHLPERLPEEIHEPFSDRGGLALLLSPGEVREGLRLHGPNIERFMLMQQDMTADSVVRRIAQVVPFACAASWSGPNLVWRECEKKPPLAALQLEWETLGRAVYRSNMKVHLARNDWECWGWRQSFNSKDALTLLLKRDTDLPMLRSLFGSW